MVELTFDAFMKRSRRASRDQEWGYDIARYARYKRILSMLSPDNPIDNINRGWFEEKITELEAKWAPHKLGE